MRWLAAEGLTGYEIARHTGVPVSTVHYWLRAGYERQSRAVGPADVPRHAYAYLLALYLGYGYIARLPRTYRLEVALDLRYPGIIEEARASMGAVLPTSLVSVHPMKGDNAVRVTGHSNSLPTLFPQHGRGPKHKRAIVLEPWQQEIVDEHTGLFLRGLIHSDGCRVMNKVWGGKYQYPRYFFTQESVDIMDLFTDACDRLGIAWAFTNRNTVSVARAASVARLDEFVGPKR